MTTFTAISQALDHNKLLRLLFSFSIINVGVAMRTKPMGYFITTNEGMLRHQI
uniref:Uncharacterized protein n=1 Tax=uncultured marine virus TaxID=186617 RepID=A0A0F7L5I6_9VIRU|nr:hypothetical protein [uncultured marine virus]